MTVRRVWGQRLMRSQARRSQRNDVSLPLGAYLLDFRVGGAFCGLGGIAASSFSFAVFSVACFSISSMLWRWTVFCLLMFLVMCCLRSGGSLRCNKGVSCIAVSGGFCCTSYMSVAWGLLLYGVVHINLCVPSQGCWSD
jgi:hypothetical protein